MTKTVIYNQHTNYVYATYDTMQGAQTAFTRACKRTAAGKSAKLCRKRVNAQKMQEAAITTFDNFRDMHDKMVTVRNLMSGKPVQLRESEVGGPCDPSTERYWSM